MTLHCQNCNSPIRLDESLQSPTRAQVNSLLSKAHTGAALQVASPALFIPKDRLHIYQTAAKGALEPLFTKDATELRLSPDESGQSYVYISDAVENGTSTPQNAEEDTEGQLPDFSKIRTLNQVFEILLTNLDVTHPMCTDCSDLLTENYKMKFDQSQREADYYLTFLKKLKAREAALESQGVAAKELRDDDLSDITAVEQKKLQELENLEQQNRELEQQLRDLNEQLERETAKVREVYDLKNELDLSLQEKEDELELAKALYQMQLNQLDELRKFNVYLRLFNILFEEKAGRINGFRLGYKVPWPECNVALGQVLLLLSFLMKRLAITIPDYKLVPLGSKSYIVKLGPADAEHGNKPRSSSVHYLYSSNEFTLGKLFNFNKLDVSMLALLDILAQFEKKLIELDAELSFPYEISLRRETVGNKSIRVTSNGQWTDACKNLLVNLNWILSYASAQ